MEPIPLILLLVACGVVLLLGELLLPTHGLLGIAGLVCIAIAIFVVFRINKWAGLGVFAATLLASPFLMTWGMSLWAKSPVGRRIILQNHPPTELPVPVVLGQVGTAATELRPMGECDFGDNRIEVISELNIIPAGTNFNVVGL
jgi:membrane-bound ClpP family serine protease